MEDLAKVIKTPPLRVQIPPSEDVEKLQRELEARREQVKKLEETVSGLKREILTLQAEREELKIRLKDLESKIVTSEERVKYESRIKALESEVNSLKEQLSEAAELETQLERVRELLGSWKDLILETCNTLGIELIPSDIQAVIQERDELRKRLEVYMREEKLREELVKDTLSDPGVRSWINDARSILRDLSRRGQAGGIILKNVLRLDPEVVFLPEEIQSGYTASTNLNYLNKLESRGLLWETRKKGRKAFRNRFRQWVAENVRRIKPSAPDAAIDKITEQLKNEVLR